MKLIKMEYLYPQPTQLQGKTIHRGDQPEVHPTLAWYLLSECNNKWKCVDPRDAKKLKDEYWGKAHKAIEKMAEEYRVAAKTEEKKEAAEAAVDDGGDVDE